MTWRPMQVACLFIIKSGGFCQTVCHVRLTLVLVFSFYKLVSFYENPFRWDESSREITSSVVDVKVKDDTGQFINVVNLTEEIELQIPTKFSKANGQAPQEFFARLDEETMQHHSFKINREGDAIELNIHPVKATVIVRVFIKFEDKPSAVDFDIEYRLPNYTSCDLSVEMLPVNCTEDPFTLYLSSGYLTKLGVYYIGIKLESTDNKKLGDSRKRTRRDCGEGGRTKRSCIQYKDPPPTLLPRNGKYVGGPFQYDSTIDGNYTMKQVTFGCQFMNAGANKWSGGGCRVSS